MTGGDLVQFYLYLTAALSSATTLERYQCQVERCYRRMGVSSTFFTSRWKKDTVDNVPSHPVVDSPEMRQRNI